jgi:LytS/YehU family sensor histidine kinase
MISLILILVSPSIFQQASIAFKWLFMGLDFKILGFDIIQKITPSYMAGYSLYIAIYFFTHYGLEYKEQREKTLKANALANEAQLQMLQYQINPHFLFNSLNTIQSMVEIDKDRAKEMIADLSVFFRHTLSGKNQVFISLKEELDALNKYLSIQKERFKDRLQVSFDIDKQSLGKNIPAFLIHPLVENSIKYGFSSTNNILELVIKTKLISNKLSITVKNAGKLVTTDRSKENKISSTKTGIENIKKRLSLLYPNNHKFELFEEDDYVTAKIIIWNIER